MEEKLITQNLSLHFQILGPIYLNLKDNVSMKTCQILLIIDLVLRTLSRVLGCLTVSDLFRSLTCDASFKSRRTAQSSKAVTDPNF